MSQIKPFFLPQQEIDVIDTINEELIDEILGQVVDIYQVDVDDTNTNMYGESDSKYFKAAFRINCLILFNEPETLYEAEYGPDYNGNIEVYFQKNNLQGVDCEDDDKTFASDNIAAGGAEAYGNCNSYIENVWADTDMYDGSPHIIPESWIADICGANPIATRKIVKKNCHKTCNTCPGFYPEIGDIIDWNKTYWEISQITQPQLKLGNENYSHQIKVLAHRSRLSALQIEERPK